MSASGQAREVESLRYCCREAVRLTSYSKHGNARIRVEQITRHRGQASDKERSGGNFALRGPGKGRIVDVNVLEKVLRPMSQLDRLQNDRIALATDGDCRGGETEFLRQGHGLALACFHNAHGCHGMSC